MPDELHKRMEHLAEQYGMSLNAFINMVCDQFDGKPPIDEARFEELEKRVTELEKKINKK